MSALSVTVIAIAAGTAGALAIWLLFKRHGQDRRDYREKDSTFRRDPQADSRRKRAGTTDYNAQLASGLQGLVNTNLRTRLAHLDSTANTAVENLIDKLNDLLNQLYAKNAADSLTGLMTKVATDHLPKVCGHYLSLPEADRREKLEEFRKTLAAIDEEVCSALEHLRQGRMAEFAVSAGLVQDLGVDVLDGQTSDDSQAPTAKLDNAARRLIQKQLEAIRQLNDPVPASERYRLTIKDLKPGGFLHWKDKYWKVEECHLYREGNKWEWTELKLFCLNDGSACNLEWEEDDRLEVTYSVKQLRWTDLTDEAGVPIDDDDLDQICRDEESIYLDRDEFEFEEDCDAVFFRDGAGEGESVWTMEFESTVDDDYGVTIEEWNGGQTASDYEIWLWRHTSADSVEVLKQGG